MACFVVPAVEAIVVTAVAKAEEKKEMRAKEEKVLNKLQIVRD